MCTVRLLTYIPSIQQMYQLIDVPLNTLHVACSFVCGGGVSQHLVYVMHCQLVWGECNCVFNSNHHYLKPCTIPCTCCTHAVTNTLTAVVKLVESVGKTEVEDKMLHTMISYLMGKTFARGDNGGLIVHTMSCDCCHIMVPLISIYN